jgi:hypothetical protein
MDRKYLEGYAGLLTYPGERVPVHNEHTAVRMIDVPAGERMDRGDLIYVKGGKAWKQSTSS